MTCSQPRAAAFAAMAVIVVLLAYGCFHSVT